MHKVCNTLSIFSIFALQVPSMLMAKIMSQGCKILLCNLWTASSAQYFSVQAKSKIIILQCQAESATNLGKPFQAMAFHIYFSIFFRYSIACTTVIFYLMDHYYCAARRHSHLSSAFHSFSGLLSISSKSFIIGTVLWPV